ncbi:MAG: hypothetical protein O9327_03145 [Polaromonas sp.]|nr:hypothetical protein [Polaromonas sp.]
MVLVLTLFLWLGISLGKRGVLRRLWTSWMNRGPKVEPMEVPKAPEGVHRLERID